MSKTCRLTGPKSVFSIHILPLVTWVLEKDYKLPSLFIFLLWEFMKNCFPLLALVLFSRHGFNCQS